MCIEAFNTDDSLSLESPINAVCESIFLQLLVISHIPSSLSVSVSVCHQAHVCFCCRGWIAATVVDLSGRLQDEHQRAVNKAARVGDT